VTLGGLTGAPAMREIKLEVMRHSHANRTVSGKENQPALKIPGPNFYLPSTGLNEFQGCTRKLLVSSNPIRYGVFINS
jgi:hypothetical protein